MDDDIIPFMKKILSSKTYGFYEKKEAFLYLSNTMKKDSFIELIKPQAADAYYNYILEYSVTNPEKYSSLIPELKVNSLLCRSGQSEISKLKWSMYFKQKKE